MLSRTGYRRDFGFKTRAYLVANQYIFNLKITEKTYRQ